MHSGPVSFAVFGPASRPPGGEYLNIVRSYISKSPRFHPLLEQLCSLSTTWAIFAQHHSEIGALKQGSQCLKTLSDWLQGGDSRPVSEATSGIINLPVLILIHIVQYFQYLDYRNLQHCEFIAQVRREGEIQGNCGGLFAACIVACGKSEEHIIELTAVFMRFVVGIGAAGELGDDSTVPGVSSIIVRLKGDSEAEELVRQFAGAYISNRADPHTFSILGPVPVIDALSTDCRSKGLLIQKLHNRGRLHHADLLNLANCMLKTSYCHQSLAIPHASELQVDVRSNETGLPLTSGNLADELVRVTLASRCDWFQVLEMTAEAVQVHRPNGLHIIVSFGIGDCVSKVPFNKRHLRTRTINVQQQLTRHLDDSPPDQPDLGGYEFPEGAIAIVGASCRLPGASKLEQLGRMIEEARDCHSELPKDRFDLRQNFRATQAPSLVSSRGFFGNFVDEPSRFDTAFFKMSSKYAVYMDPQQRMLLELAYEALESSGYFPTRCKYERTVGCFIGSCVSEYAENTAAHPPHARVPTGTFQSFLCGKICHHFGWTSPSEVIDTACSSSLVAVYRACKALQTRECTTAVAGGIMLLSSLSNFLDLAKGGFLSPSGQSKPFDNCADGYCRSEGGGLVVLRPLTTAIEDHDTILGVIPSIFVNQSGQSPSLIKPHQPTQVALLQETLRQANLRSDQVSYVECHGPGTQAEDPVEMDSVREVFGGSDRQSYVTIGSVKGNLGHSEAAAGVTGLLKIIAMLMRGNIPPLASHKTLNTKIARLEPDMIRIPTQLESWDTPWRVACVHSYSASGSDCAALCADIPKPYARGNELRSPSSAWDIVVSAACVESLVGYCKTLGTYLLQASTPPRLEDVALTLNAWRQPYAHALVVSATHLSELATKLVHAEAPSVTLDTTPRSVVLLFCGQSKRWVGLNEAFYNEHLAFRLNFDMCDEISTKKGYGSLREYVFQAAPIADLVLLQLGLFAVQYATAKSWIDAGLHVDALVGHSFGEFATLAVAEVLSLEDCIILVAGRAQLTQRLLHAEHGAMLTINTDMPTAHEIVEHYNECQGDSARAQKLSVACINSKSSQVLSGSTRAIDGVQEYFKPEARWHSIRAQRLNTSHGFHSELFEPLIPDLDNMSHSLSWNAPKIRVVTCTPGEDAVLDGSRPARHARDSVHLMEAVKRTEQELGPCAWIEGGVDTGATALAKAAVGSTDRHAFHALSTKAQVGPSSALGEVLRSLWKAGVACSQWSVSRSARVWLPPYQFSGPKLWLPSNDHTTEANRQLNLQTGKTADAPQSRALMLVDLEAIDNTVPTCQTYRINTSCERFKQLVTGHGVCGRPVCPGGLFMECVAMILQSCGHDLLSHDLKFENINFKTALGLNPSKRVTLTMEALESSRSWNFEFVSDNENARRDTSHATGQVRVIPASDISILERLVTGQLKQISSNSNLEKLCGSRAYALFSRVIRYKSFYQGITNISLDASQAYAEINVPRDQPALEESTVTNFCDAVPIDIFVQVVGLLINTSDVAVVDDVWVGTAIESVSWTSKARFNDSRKWVVFARFESVSHNSALGDVFAMTDGGQMAMTILGVGFSRMPIQTLSRLLDAPKEGKQDARFATAGTNGPSLASREVFPDGSALLTHPATSSQLSVPNIEDAGSRFDFPNDSPTSIANEKSDARKDLRKLICEYTQILPSQITDDVVVEDLGIDSLTAVELTEDINNMFQKAMSAEDFSGITYKQMEQNILGLSNTPEKKCSPTNAVDSSQQKNIGTINQESSHSVADMRIERLGNVIAETIGFVPDSQQLLEPLRELGYDSLTLIAFTRGVEEAFGVAIPDGRLSLESTLPHIAELVRAAGLSAASSQKSRLVDSLVSANHSQFCSAEVEQPSSSAFKNPAEALTQAEAAFDSIAKRVGFEDYWGTVAVEEESLATAYILEAYATLGVGIDSIPPHEQIFPMKCLPKFDRLAQRFLDTLEKHDLAVRKADQVVRSSREASSEPAATILNRIITKYPAYGQQARLISLVGSQLDKCVTGKVNPVAILFGSKNGLALLEDWYRNAPPHAAMTEQLVRFIEGLLPEGSDAVACLDILEVGAGTGGTTHRLLEALKCLGVRVRYTFTDIAPRMVQKAEQAFAGNPFMTFRTLNIEEPMPADMQGRFDLVLGTNCVHATSSRVSTLCQLRAALNMHGLICLSEGVCITPWSDIPFGLLDGWWRGKDYPIQPPEVWMTDFTSAGFASCTYSRGCTLESNTQSLLVGVNSHEYSLDRALQPARFRHSRRTYRMQTFKFKEIDGIELSADVYLPHDPPKCSMPIAIMVHGGGYMTLSRKAIRPAQTAFLLSQGVLPLSIDYRLCPEIDILNGAMSDVRDAYVWAVRSLPSIVGADGIVVDPNRIVLVGWSTGGHLAMTTAWTVSQQEVPPPKAILSFYGPTDFESGDLDASQSRNLPRRTLSYWQIIEALPLKPITGYHASKGIDASGLGIVRPGDPRFELVLSLFSESALVGLPLLLSGHPRPRLDAAMSAEDTDPSLLFPHPDEASVQAISPIAQVRAGRYTVPTFVIHSTDDEIVPYRTAVNFVDALHGGGVKAGLLTLSGVRHIHDMELQPGTQAWQEGVEPGYRFLFDRIFGP